MNQIVPIDLSPDVRIALVQTAAGELVGLGTISIGEVALRSDARPLTVRLDTPDGIIYPHLFVSGVEKQGDGAVQVQLRAIGMPWGRAEYADEYDQTMVMPQLTTEPVEDALTLTLAPAQLELGGKTWQGFSYTFHFHSEARQIHRLWTNATWEIGGQLDGNTVLHQGQCNMQVYHGATAAPFTTTCLKTLDQYGSPQGVSYQLAPRGGLIQTFDFQYSTAGALLMYWPHFGSISSLLDSPAGCDVLHVVDEYRFTLSSDVTTTAKCILFTPGELAEHEARDLWWEAYQFVNGGIRAAFGMEETLVVPEVGQRYTARLEDKRVKVLVVDEWVDSTDMLHALADKALPRMAQQGIKRFFPEVISQSDVSEIGTQCKLDGGLNGELHCSSVCCTHRFLPAEFWGGMAGWKYLADKAKALGIELGHWFAPHYSPRAPIYQEHPEYRMIGANTLPTGGGYGFQSLLGADWNTGIYEYTLNDIQRWKEEGGLDYIFTDSWANLGLIQVNFSQRMRANYEALGRLYADFQQKLGIKLFSFEGISPFGASRFGAADMRGDLLDATQGIVGQNDFGWWVNNEDMAFNICLCTHPRKRNDEELARIQFRLMANRACPMYETIFDMAYTLPTELARLNHIYLQALPDMRTRRLLPDGLGVSWQHGDTTILWSYRAAPLPTAAHVEVLDVTGAKPVTHDGTLQLQPYTVYRLSGVPVGV